MTQLHQLLSVSMISMHYSIRRTHVHSHTVSLAFCVNVQDKPAHASELN